MKNSIIRFFKNNYKLMVATFLIGRNFENANAIEPNMRYKFIKYFMSVDFNYVDTDEETINYIKNLSEYKNMNMYPYNNSIKIIDGILVVKFSD